MRRRLFSLLCLATAIAPQAAAGGAAAAAQFYENALGRLSNDDVPGAIIQLKNALQEDGRMLAAHVLLARALQRDGQYQAAMAAYEDALKMGVDPSEIAIPLGRLYLALGQPKKVLERLMTDSLPDGIRAEAMTIRASAESDLGNVATALAELDKAKMLAPSSALPWIAEASILLGAGRREEAAHAADTAVARGPDDANAWNVKASVTQAGGNLERALEEYARAAKLDPDRGDVRVASAAILVDLGRAADANAELDSAAKADDGDPRVPYLRSILAERARQPEAVARLLREAQQRMQRLPQAWVVRHEQFLMVGALVSHALGSRESATEYLRTLLKGFPQNLGARKLLASIQIDADDAATALGTLEPVLRVLPNDPQAVLLAGRAEYALGRHKRALRLLERAATLDASPEALRALGQSQLATGDTAEGIRNLEKVLASRPEDAGLVFALASRYLRSGRKPDAEKIVAALVARVPDSPSNLNMLGVVKSANGDSAGARNAYREAARLAPDFLPPQLNLARMDLADGRHESARQALIALKRQFRNPPEVSYELGRLEEGLQNIDDAIAHYRTALEKDPRSMDIGVALVDILLRTRHGHEALEIARGLVYQLPSNKNTLELLARAQLAVGDRSGAAQSYQEMTRLGEFDPEVQVRVGELNLAAGFVDAAAYNVSKALAGSPGLPEAKLLEGHVALARGDLGRVRQIVAELRETKSIELPVMQLAIQASLAAGRIPEALAGAKKLLLRERSAKTVRLVAATHVQAGDRKGAIDLLGEWLAAHPDDFGQGLALAELLLADGKLDEARHEYERLHALDGTHPGVLNNLALVLVRQGEFDQAVSTARNASRLAPDDPLVLDTLGWALTKAGALDEGLRFLRDARLRLPGNPEVRWHLGFTLSMLGRKSDARTEIEEALRIGVAFEGSKEARRLLVDL